MITQLGYLLEYTPSHYMPHGNIVVAYTLRQVEVEIATQYDPNGPAYVVTRITSNFLRKSPEVYPTGDIQGSFYLTSEAAMAAGDATVASNKAAVTAALAEFA